ncbi:MAG TPA: type III pantothenate kinase [Burkholderiales bacterium]
MILAVDAGNSRVKWALHDGRAFAREAWVALADVRELGQAWTPLPQPSRIVVANVAGDGMRDVLSELFGKWNAEVIWAAGRRSQCGVTSLYENPAQLGPDRWAALIGARHLEESACLIVNSGTAMTVDALTAAGEFLGGLIVPGFDLMHQILARSTALLSAEPGRYAAFPRNSADAVTSGAIHALCGAVERMKNEMAAAGHGEPAVLISGGAGGVLAEHLRTRARYVERLVLEGLVRIAGGAA